MKFVLIAGLLLSMGSTASAALCGNGSLQNYLSLGSGGCQLGVVTFSNFQVVSGQNGATAIGATEVQVTPSGSPLNPLFMISFTNPTATSGQLLESIFRFSVSGAPLTGASLALAGSATGDGVVTNVLNVCPGGNFNSNAIDGCPNSRTAITFISAIDQQFNDSTGPVAASFFDVFFDLTLDGGPNGSATLSSATVGVTATPEPAAGLLFAAGLAAIAGLRARRLR